MQLIDAFPILVRHTQLLDDKDDHKLHYDNCCKDMQCFEYYGCSYTTYINHMIDLLCHHEDSYGLQYPDDECSHSGIRSIVSCRRFHLVSWMRVVWIQSFDFLMEIGQILIFCIKPELIWFMLILPFGL